MVTGKEPFQVTTKREPHYYHRSLNEQLKNIPINKGPIYVELDSVRV